MAVASFSRAKFFWGLVEVEHGTDPYQPAETFSLGASAVEGSGVGCRRTQLVFARTPPSTASEDVAVMHFDWLNLTGGEPDDTWTSSDFTAIEDSLSVWFTAIQASVHTSVTWKEIRWYRIGTGVTPPNPPVRVTSKSSPGTSSSTMLPPQCASTISMHVAPRRSWGRTYLPGLTTAAIETGGVLTHAFVDLLASSSSGLITNAASADFHLVVLSRPHVAALSVESIAVDNIVDIQRRRRWEHPGYKKVLPAPS